MTPEQAKQNLEEIYASALFHELQKNVKRQEEIEAEFKALSAWRSENASKLREMTRIEDLSKHIASGKCLESNRDRFARVTNYCKNAAKFPCKCGAVLCGTHKRGHYCRESRES